MLGNVILGVRMQCNEFQRIKLENIDLEDKVETLRNEAAKKINVDKGTIDLIYCGIVLEDDNKISSCGVRSGVMVHILKRKEESTLVKPKECTEADVQRIYNIFKNFTYVACYRTILQKLSRPEVLENIVALTPGLANDPVAIAMIKDTETMTQLSEEDTIRKIGEVHPALIDAAQHIAAYIREELNCTDRNRATTSSGYSYSLEALSDDDDMDVSDSSREAAPLTRNSSYNAITAAQLSAAIANATGSRAGSGAFRPSLGRVSHITTVPSPSIITTEMFGNALQQAYASSPNLAVPNSPASSSQPTPTSTESFESITSRLQPQLLQMREMGLGNETVNIRALQTTAGDVQAAVELVLSGAFE